jgi:hypothetical protein
MSVKNIVLVHGAWADGSSWSKVIPLLRASGLHAVAVQNPSSSLADDVASTNRLINVQYFWSAIPTVALSSPKPGTMPRSQDLFMSPPLL